MALVGTLEFPQSCCIYMSAFATRQDNSVYLPRIVNTAAGFKLLVWRRGVLVHRCPRASRSGLYETVTLTSFAPSCFPPERSLGAAGIRNEMPVCNGHIEHVRGNVFVLQQITEDITKEPISPPCIKRLSQSSTCFIYANLRALQSHFNTTKCD